MVVPKCGTQTRVDLRDETGTETERRTDSRTTIVKVVMVRAVVVVVPMIVLRERIVLLGMV